MDHFNFLAPWYDQIIQPKDPQKLIEIADLPVEGTILDAGGGTGRIAQVLTGQAERVVVSDPSFGMLQQARAKAGLYLICSHAENLSFPSNFFERIIMVDAFHHVNDQVLSAQELWRVLVPGGRLVIEEPDIRQFSIKLVAFAEKLALMRSHFLNPNLIAKLFSYPNASTRIESEDHNAWIIVDKSGD